MKSLNAGIALAVLILSVSAPLAAYAATTPFLGAAASFGVLTRTLTSTTIPYGANVFGDVGYATTTGVIIGTSAAPHVADATFLQAGVDQHAAASALNAQACTFAFAGAVDLGSDTTHGALGVYTPGVYCSTGNMSIGGGATIALSGAGTYIFRPQGTLTTSDLSIATTTSGASPCDVFWTPQVPPVLASTVLGSDTRFVGTVIEPVGPANSDITVGAGTKWVGRALAYDWTVTTNPIILKYVTITAPTCPVPPVPPAVQATLHVIKHVVNNDGGIAPASSFILHVKGVNGMGISDVAGSPAAGVEAPGTFNFTSDLTIGSTGNQVIELQKFLIAQGFSIPLLTSGQATYGYFGAQTRSALAKYQSAHGITPAVGYFGPITRAQVNVGSTPTMTDEQRSILLAALITQLHALQAQLAALQAAGH